MKTVFSASLILSLTLGLSACSDSSPSGPPDDLAKSAPPSPLAVQQIAYYSAPAGLTLINLDGSGLTRLGGGRSPAWSPDGKKLVFSNTECDTDWYSYYVCERGGLVIMDPETRTASSPAAGALGDDPAWSPDGNQIAFVRYTNDGYRLFVMRLDGTPAREIITTGINNIFGLSWSPDGRRLAFQCDRGGTGICAINADGTGFAQLAVSGVSPSWSPDGKRIAFSVLGNDTGTVSLMAADGTGVIQLTEGLTPSWSSDGSRIVFSRNFQGLFVIQADGSGLTRVTTGNDGHPAWRPKLSAL